MLPHVVCYAVISPVRGRVYFHYGIRSFTAEDFKVVLRETRAAYGPGPKLALFLDNCRIHQANIVRDYAATEEIAIDLVWNLAYRPDIAAGIESLWSVAK